MHLTKDKIVWLSYLIVAFILLLGSNEQRLYKANLLSITVYYPLISSVNQIEELFTLRERNKILSERLAHFKTLSNTLQSDLHSLKSIVRLQEQSNFQHGVPLDFKVSSIIAYRGSFTNRTLIIDKGKADGIEKSFPVISENGIVGKIINVFPKHSIVLPMNSPHFKVGVVTENSSVQGLLEADISGSLYMTMIPSGSPVGVGDVVTTSSVSTFFPQGYPVGIISSLLKTPEDIYLRAKIDPFTEINNLEQVIVLFYEKELPEE